MPRFQVEPDGALCHRVVERLSGKVATEHCLRGNPGTRPINTRQLFESDGVRLRVIVLRDDISFVDVRPVGVAWSMVGHWLLLETSVDQTDATVLRVRDETKMADCPLNEFDTCYVVEG
jgi:hypothetical protein